MTASSKKLKSSRTAKETFLMLRNDAIKFKRLADDIFGKKYNTQAECLLKIDELHQASFYKWLNQWGGFRSAKEKLIKAGLIPENLDDKFSANQPKEYVFLEYFFANFVPHICSDSEFADSAVIFLSKQKRQTQKHVDCLMNIRVFDFECDAEGLLFSSLLKKLKSSCGNPIFLKKKDDMQIRLYMSKRLVKALLMNFRSPWLTKNLIANVTLDVTGILFSKSMNKYDVELLVDELRDFAEQEITFLNKRVVDILDEYRNEIDNSLFCGKTTIN